NAVTAYDDVGALTWKVWGDGWDPGVGTLSGEIVYPKPVSDPAQIYSWGHPQLDGKIGLVENRRLLFEIHNVPSHQWVEIRTAFPRDQLDAVPAYAIVKNEAGLEKIEQEEKNNAFKDQVHAALLPVIVLAYLAFLIWAYFKFGRDPKVEYDAIYEHDPPYDYGPATVQAMQSDVNRKPNTNGFVAEIFNLALLGYLQFERVKKEKVLGLFGPDYDYKVSFTTPRKPAALTKSQENLLDILHKYNNQADSFLFSKFQENCKAKRLTFVSSYSNWQKDVQQETDNMNFFEPRTGLKRVLIGTALFAALLFILFPPFVFFLIWIGLFSIPVLANILTKRTPEGVLHHKRWKNFKKFLMDFSRLKQYPPETLIIWERFMVYAIAFGIADKVAQSMQVLVPQNEYAHSAIFVGGYSAGA
ncbi:MAG: DUF2207 domain-containing protein, partial [Candidatus Diapherotrites archaeon]|nr:DUF2207 domain-containing protein [Candidatus Diapherotrites archaeon]